MDDHEPRTAGGSMYKAGGMRYVRRDVLRRNNRAVPNLTDSCGSLGARARVCLMEFEASLIGMSRMFHGSTYVVQSGAIQLKGVVNSDTHTSMNYAPQRKEQGAHI
jgi:hypothetical protein